MATPRIELLRGRITDYPRLIDDDGLAFYGPTGYVGRTALVPCGGCNGWGKHESGKCDSCNGVGYYFTLPFDGCEVCGGANLGVPKHDQIPEEYSPLRQDLARLLAEFRNPANQAGCAEWAADKLEAVLLSPPLPEPATSPTVSGAPAVSVSALEKLAAGWIKRASTDLAPDPEIDKAIRGVWRLSADELSALIARGKP